MRKVSIYYNPYLDRTRLVIDGIEHSRKGKRIDELIVGQPLTRWLFPYVLSYRRWDGILSELMEDLNDDEIELSFCSLPEYFSMVQEELRKQSTTIEEKGYDPRFWIFKGVAYYLPENVVEGVRSFIRVEKHFLPSQHSMILMDYAEEMLMEETFMSVKKLTDVLDTLKAVVQTAKKDCQTKEDAAALMSHWNKSERELYVIYGGKAKYEHGT